MGKGILAGIIWGAISSLLVVVAVSLNTPLPGPEAANVDAPAGSEFTRPPEGTELVVPVLEAPTVPRAPVVTLGVEAPDVAPQTDAPVADTSTAQISPPVQQVAELGEGLGANAGEPVTAPVSGPSVAPSLPDLPDIGTGVLDEALSLADSAAADQPPIQAPELSLVDPVGADPQDVAEQIVVAEPEPTEGEELVTPELTTDPGLPEQITEPGPEAEPDPGPAAPETAAPAPQTVTTGRLPSIATTPSVPVQPLATPSVFNGALARNALQIELEQGLPLFSIVLIDRTGEGLPLAEIASLPIPVAVAMDPSVAGAAEAAEGYRATGHEVLVLAENLPLGGNAADLTIAVTALLGQIPSAVGVLLPPGSDLARNRAAMDQVANLLAQSGHGLVLVPQGLNAAGQAADAANVPTASIFRVLDAADEGVPLMTRYMDRAAFEASRDQSVAVLGTIQPSTIEALLSWVDGRRAGTVAVAPISAIMLQ